MTKEKLNWQVKVYLLSFLIWFPLLIILWFSWNYYESQKEMAWITQSDGSIQYNFRWQTDKLPDSTDVLLEEYKDSKITYFNFEKLANWKFSWSVYFFTEDDFSKVKEFYEKSLKEFVKDSSEDTINILKNWQEFKISKQNILPDDKIQTWTKVEIRFYEK